MTGWSRCLLRSLCRLLLERAGMVSRWKIASWPCLWPREDTTGTKLTNDPTSKECILEHLQI